MSTSNGMSGEASLAMPLVYEGGPGIVPVGRLGECSYCGSKVGETHGSKCVTVRKQVSLRFTVNAGKELIHFDMKDSLPLSWSKQKALFHYNENTFCLDNLLDQIKADGDEPERLKAQHIAKALELSKDCACSVGVVELNEDWDTPVVLLPHRS